MRKNYLLRLFTMVMLLITGAVQGINAADDLQEYINHLSSTRTRSSSEPTIIDLSQFASTVRETTLEVKNGLYVRFVNGTLSRTKTIDGPIIRISDGAKVEWGDHAVCNSAGLILGQDLVRVEDGTFNIIGGTVEAPIDVNKILGQPNLSISNLPVDIAVNLASSSSVFLLNGGNVDGVLLGLKSKIPLEYGNVDVVIGGLVDVTGKVAINAIVANDDVFLRKPGSCRLDNVVLLNEKSALYLSEHLDYDINVYKGYVDTKAPIANGGHGINGYYRYVWNNSAVVKADGSFIGNLDEKDLSHIKCDGEGYIQRNDGTWDYGYKYVLKDNNEIVVQPKNNGIATADDLQKKLDEIADAGTYTRENPCVITIPEEGIVIDKQLYLKEKCHAVITGGTIRLSKNLQTYAAFLSKEVCSLTFKDIAIDINNNLGVQNFACFYYDGAYFTIDEGVEFKNISPESSMALCYADNNTTIIYKSGHFFSKGDIIKSGSVEKKPIVYVNGGMLESESTAIHCGYVVLSGTGTVIGGDVVIECDYINMSEGSTIKSTKKNGTLVKLLSSDGIEGGEFVGEGAKLYVGNVLYIKYSVDVQKFELGKTAQICFQSYDKQEIFTQFDILNNPSSSAEAKQKALIYLSKFKKTIISDWAQRELNEDIVYEITEDEFKYLLQFSNVPDDLEVYYNKKAKAAQLRKKNNDDLQDFLNGLGNNKGTEDDPVEIPIDDDFEMKGDVSLDDLQAFIDGIKDDGSNKTITFNGGNINVTTGSTLTLRNVDFMSTGKGGYINVSGTLIIDVNINIIKIIQFIHVEDGGRVIWRGGGGSATEIVINVTGGTVEYHYGDYYGGHYGFYNHGGYVYIYDGTIRGGWSGGYTHADGHTYVSGGTVSGGYINWGHTTISGGSISGTVSTGNGSGRWHVDNGKGGTFTVSDGTIGDGGNNGIVGNDGDLYLDNGTHGISDIYVYRNGRIYINFSLTVIIRIHISITEIVLNTPIIIGYDGYGITENDLKNIVIELPEGYEWKFDEVKGGIIIIKSTGINDITADSDDIDASYSLNGVKQKNMQKGLNIIRRKDGSVRKVMVK